MKKLGALFVAGLMAFVLSACGEDKPKQPEVQSDTMTTQPATMHEEAKPAESTDEQKSDVNAQDAQHNEESQDDAQAQE